MGQQMERSPVLAAPRSKDIGGLLASSTTTTSGRTGLYMGRGIAPDELRSASVAGLSEASRRYDPQRGPFGPYARLWCRGEILACFKPGKDALGRSSSLNIPVFKDDDEGESFLDRVPDESAPGLNPDVSDLTEKERRVVLGLVSGETLEETGKDLNLSAERIRQLRVRASDKLRKSKGSAARGAISDLVRRRGYEKPLFQSPPSGKQTSKANQISWKALQQGRDRS